MKAIGLFEAKTKFSEICDRVAENGVPVVVTKRGKPIVRIEPVRPKNKPKSIWEDRERYIESQGPLQEDLELPAREKQAWRNPLEQ